MWDSRAGVIAGRKERSDRFEDFRVRHASRFLTLFGRVDRSESIDARKRSCVGCAHNCPQRETRSDKNRGKNVCLVAKNHQNLSIGLSRAFAQLSVAYHADRASYEPRL